MRKIIDVLPAPRGHWVGDGFPVRSLFSHNKGYEAQTPFLMLDYAGPAEFAPTPRPRGVDVHPHKGFETVTIVYQGEVEHGDSTGQGGVIRPGDVQWMTAANGILHKEFHSQDFTRKGGTLEMVQLWVNLPAKDKGAQPGYQSITADQIPVVTLDDGAGTLRVIAGAFENAQGPARTFSEMDMLDIRLSAGKRLTLTPKDGHTVLVVVLDGTVTVNEKPATGASVVRLSREGGEVTLEAGDDAKVLFLDGAPIDEPMAAYGPFVMNTNDEIRAAIDGFRRGEFGRL